MNTIDLAKQLISKKSITPDDAGCQKILIERLKKMGFEVTEYNKNGVSNFWATHGTEKPIFCFAGHTDVVPPGDEKSWQTPPFTPTEKNGSLFGRGAADMKSSLAAMVVATENFLKENPNHSGMLAFLMTSDEEGPGEFGTKYVIDRLLRSARNDDALIDYCLVGEASSDKQLGDTIKIGRRGSLHGTLVIRGVQGHIAYPEKAKNPIHNAMKPIEALNQVEWDKGNEHFPATQLQFYDIQSGVGAGNVIPPNLTAKFNFRYCPESTKDSLEATMRRVLEIDDTEFELTFQKESPSYYSTPGKLTNACEKALQEHCKIKPKLSTNGGTSDGRFIAKICKEVIEFGPINESIHQINENIKIDDLKSLTHIYHAVLSKLLT